MNLFEASKGSIHGGFSVVIELVTTSDYLTTSENLWLFNSW
jgi:hypothetical protein